MTSETVRDAGAAGLQTRVIAVAGMTCDHCSRRVERALRAVPGVREAAVDRAAGRATVVFDPGSVTAEQLPAVIVKAGYAASCAT